MIEFFNEDIDYTPPTPHALKTWIQQVVSLEQYQLGDLNYIFCSDPYLLEINRKYLDHDYHTDIITFDLSENDDQIAGDIFISVDRIRENAQSFQVEEHQELQRVMVHGVLHLMGYDDKDADQKLEMRKKEEDYLSL